MTRRCPDIELVEITEEEWFGKEPRCIVPTVVRIDGQDICYEKGSVRIIGGADDECVRVQITLFAGSLTVKQELES